MNNADCTLGRVWTHSAQITVLAAITATSTFMMGKVGDTNIHRIQWCVVDQYYNGASCVACTASGATVCDACYGTNRNSDCTCVDNYYSAYSAGTPSTYDCRRCTLEKCKICNPGPGTCTTCSGNFRTVANNCECDDGYKDNFVFGTTSSYDCVPC